MERLRAAIEQARKARAAAGADKAGASDGHAPPAADAGVVGASHRTDTIAGPLTGGEPSDIVARWAALPEAALTHRRLKRSRIIAAENDPDRPAYDMLRTRLLTLIQKEGWRRVAITSPTPGCGKTTTALNLAMVMSKQRDVPTIVCETDMRRPAMANMLGITGTDSFYDVLLGKAEFSDQAVRIGDNVALSINHGVASDPAELLHRRRTGAVLDMIQEAYEPGLMLFDLPPMLNNDDTLAFIKHVDCAILLARAESTTLDQIDQCERELAAHTNVAGVVLNACRYSLQKYGYSAYYN
jgi:Mrp family chromosome partitioning ATPase